MSRRVAGMTRDEYEAYRIVTALLGATSDRFDGKPGREKAVDAILTLADRRRASFEVTMLPNDFMEASAMVERDGYSWPPAGRWIWSVTGARAKELMHLRKIYADIITVCEAADADYPHFLYEDHPELVDDNIRWLVEHSECSMTASIGVPAAGRPVSVGLGWSLAGKFDAPSELVRAVTESFDTSTMRRHVAKAGRPHKDEGPVDERHLFVWIMPGTTPKAESFFHADDGLLPTVPPPDLPGITHLWLAHWTWWRILLWSERGWSEHWKPGTPPLLNGKEGTLIARPSTGNSDL